MEENKSNSNEKSDISKDNDEPVKEVKMDDKPVENTDSEQDTKESSNESSNNESNKEEQADLNKKIRKQVEFYFGDVNMQRDKFLIEQTKLDDGWVPMTVMLNFKMLASLSKDIEVILKALEDSDLIEISEDRKKVRRSPSKPLPVYDENYRKNQETRTIYLKGFPADSTIGTLKSYFESTESVENIIMRKYKKGKEQFFKGSIFVQFKTVDDAKAFMEQESIKYKDTELIKMWLVDYVASKEKEREEWQQKKLKNQNNAKNENSKGSKNGKNNVQDEIKLPKGCVIHISDVQKDITRENIKQKLIELGSEVAYIDYNTGDMEGWIRLQGENAAVDLLKKLDSNKIQINSCDVVCKLLEGEEEEAYLCKIQENMVNHRLNRREKGRNTRKNFKRRHSPHREGNAKKLCADD